VTRPAWFATIFALALVAFAPPALGGVAEIRDAHGRLTADAEAVGTYASAQDGGWALRFDSATRTRRGVSLTGVSLAGGLVYAAHVYVPARGLRGARVVGLTVNGKPVPANANSLVPLGPASYLVVLQEAVVPGEGSGIVGLRLVAGDSSLGLDPGSQVLVGLARAALPATHRAHKAARLSWLALGVTGHGADTGFEDLGLPATQLLDVPTNGSVGSRAVQIALQYLGVPYVWGGADPLTGFDCSGLTMYVYAQLGIQLTHYTGSQFYEGARVPPWALEPGDLLFFEPSSRGPQHEGMYIGGGRFIQAPHTGDVVKISSLSQPGYAFGFVGAVRPFG
jgi:cell wall-associated NlpC family hydrolase